MNCIGVEKKNKFNVLFRSSIKAMQQESDNFLPVSPLVVIPSDELHKVVVQSNASLGIKNARPVTVTIANDIYEIHILCNNRKE